MRLIFPVFAQIPFRVGAAGVEVAQCDMVYAVCGRIVAEHLLADELGTAIWIDRRWRRVFRDWELFRTAIDRAGAGEHDRVTAGTAHSGQQTCQAADIIVVVARRIDDGLADISVSGKMDDGLDLMGGDGVAHRA